MRRIGKAYNLLMLSPLLGLNRLWNSSIHMDCYKDNKDNSDKTDNATTNVNNNNYLPNFL